MKLKLPQALFTAVLAALAAVPAQAATYTWGGSNNELWWTEGAWKDGTTSVKWANGSNAILNGSGSAGAPMRAKFSGTGEISAKDVTVTTGTYFRLTCQDTPTINFSSLTVSQDSTLEIGGSLANRPFAVTNLALNGTMTIKSAMDIAEISSLSSTGSLTIQYDSETTSGNVVTIGKISGLSKAISITGAALTLGSKTTPATIEVTDAITVTGGDTTGYLDDKGKTAKNGNGFRTVSQASMTLFTLSSVTEKKVTYDAKLTPNGAQVIRNVGDGKDGVYTLASTGIATKAAGTDYSTYYLKTGDDSVSAMAKAASDKKGELTTVDMTSSGTLTVDAALDTLYAHTQGGTVDMRAGLGITNMTVNADTTILTAEGKTVETTMEVERGKEVSIEGKGGIKTGGVVIAGRDNKTPATITNDGESADYTPGNDAMKISNATVEVTDGSAAVGDLLTINNKLTDTKLINKSGVTVRSTDGAGLTDIAAISGNVAVTNLAALSLDTLTIAAGEQVGVYTGNEMTEAAVAELTVKGTLTVGGAGASLNANLTLGSGSVLDLSAGSALTLGCTLGLEDGLTFVLSEQQLNDLTTGGSVLLMDGVDGLSGTLPTSFTVTDSDGQAFGGPVVLTYQGTELRLIPEPATATLSLLALAGLAARRRRK